MIELVIVISILGIMAFILVNIMQGPVRAYVDTEKRARLVDIAQTALQRMTREVRLALPNSIVAGGGQIEFLRTIDGGRYRDQGANRLKFNKQADSFEFLGPLNNFAAINAVGGTDQNDCLDGNVHCLVIYNTGQPGADAYAGDNIAAVTAKAAGSLSFDLGPTVDRFPNKSPRQRFFVVDTPVRFVCNLGTGQIRRYDGYTIGGAPVGAGNLLIDRVTNCSMTYNPGTNTRSALVTISITITDSGLGQSVTLLQQAHVDNQP